MDTSAPLCFLCDGYCTAPENSQHQEEAYEASWAEYRQELQRKGYAKIRPGVRGLQRRRNERRRSRPHRRGTHRTCS